MIVWEWMDTVVLLKTSLKPNESGDNSDGLEVFFVSNLAEFQTFIIGVAVLTMKAVVSHSYVRPCFTIAKLYAANTTFEASNVIKQFQTFNNHGSSAP